MAENLDIEISNLEETFNKAALHVQTSLLPKLDTKQLLTFYGLYKQATSGICDLSAPSWYKIQAKQKWEAWNSLGKMSKKDAMEKYILAVNNLNPDWEIENQSQTKTWVVVSRLPNTDIELEDVEKTLLDWIKDSNEEKVRFILANEKQDLHLKDSNGMLPVHWAADRGNIEIFKCLIEAGSDINALDDDGQTPMDYAESCGHNEIVEYLSSINIQNPKTSIECF